MRRFGRRALKLLGVAGILFGNNAAHASGPAIDGPNELIERGEYLAKAADCAACHTIAQNKPFAGGLGIQSPVGVIYSTNITPSMNFGIGRYTQDQFARALRRGIRDDGANLYPAMPYTSYSLLTDEDVRALYAFFMKSVAPVDARGRQTALSFPLNIRSSMKAWNLIFLNTSPYQKNSSRNAQWNRGRYLVQALAHCGECHTPRSFLMQTEPGLELAGAQIGPWYAPNITSDAVSGVGSWSIDALAQYLRTGVLLGKARAAGSMAEAVEDSFQYLTDADLRAMALYVLSVPAIHDKSETSSRFSLGKAFSELGMLRGRSGIHAESGNPSGAELFQANCGSCHEPLGQGSKGGYYPSLFDNSAVGAGNPNNLIATILYGVSRKTSAGQVYMPGFGGGQNDLAALTDDQIALLANYLIDHFGRGGRVTAQTAAEVRHGGPSSALPGLARAGVGFGSVAAIAVAVLLFRLARRRGQEPASR